jgi:hypothetical protein
MLTVGQRVYHHRHGTGTIVYSTWIKHTRDGYFVEYDKYPNKRYPHLADGYFEALLKRGWKAFSPPLYSRTMDDCICFECRKE